MKLNHHHIDIVLAASQLTGMASAVQTLDTSCTFLEGSTPKDRIRLKRVGPKTLGFALQALDLGKQNGGLLPRDFDLPAAERDLAAREQLQPIVERLRRIVQLFDETLHLIDADLFTQSCLIYRCLSEHGEGAGLEPALEELSQRFTRKRRKPVAGESSAIPAVTSPGLDTGV